MSDPDWEQRVAAVWSDAGIGDDDRVEQLRALAAVAPSPALGAFELGGALDSAGREAEAAEQYAAAVSAGLVDADRGRAAQLAVQYASTLRNLGRTDEAIAMLRAAPAHESTGAAPAVFLALALHSAGRYGEALQVVIAAIEPSLPRYHRSVRGYAAELTAE